MREAGVVQEVRGEEALVRLERHSACLGCRACSVGTGGEMLIKTVASGEIKRGDKVALQIDSLSVLRAIVILYLIPTIAFVSGIAATLTILPAFGITAHKEALSLLTGVVLLCAALWIARGYGLRRKEAYRAKITEVVK